MTVSGHSKIVRRCNFSLNELRYEYPNELAADSFTHEAHLRQEMYIGAYKRFAASNTSRTTADASVHAAHLPKWTACAWVRAGHCQATTGNRERRDVRHAGRRNRQRQRDHLALAARAVPARSARSRIARRLWRMAVQRRDSAPCRSTTRRYVSPARDPGDCQPQVSLNATELLAEPDPR
jgi:hypothetical protein